MLNNLPLPWYIAISFIRFVLLKNTQACKTRFTGYFEAAKKSIRTFLDDHLLTQSVTLFKDNNQEPHWMDVSRRYRFGQNIDEAWCDLARVDKRSHLRPFRSTQPGGFMPNGENRWFLGTHWRDARTGQYIYWFMSKPSGDPKTPHYNLAAPHARSIFNVWKDIHMKQSKASSPRVIFSTLLGLSLVGAALAFSLMSFGGFQPAPAQTVTSSTFAVAPPPTAVEHVANPHPPSSSAEVVVLHRELQQTQQKLLSVLDLQAQQLSMIERQSEELDDLRKRIKRLEQRRYKNRK